MKYDYREVIDILVAYILTVSSKFNCDKKNYELGFFDITREDDTQYLHQIDIFHPGEVGKTYTSDSSTGWRVKVHCYCGTNPINGPAAISGILHIEDPQSLEQIKNCILHKAPLTPSESSRLLRQYPSGGSNVGPVDR